MLEKKGENKRMLAGKIALAAVALLLISVLTAGAMGKHGKNADTQESRMAFITEMGWETEPDSEEERDVKIPSCDEGAMAEYNALMKRGGYDLTPFEGKTVKQYTYKITNYSGYAQTVYLTLYVDRGEVIGGDIHSAALNGFMHELRARDPE